jgi:hypothetical protein
MSENRIRARANYLLFVLQIVRQNQLIFSQAGSDPARIGAEISSKIRKKTNDQRQERRKGRMVGSRNPGKSMEKSIYNITPLRGEPSGEGVIPMRLCGAERKEAS